MKQQPGQQLCSGSCVFTDWWCVSGELWCARRPTLGPLQGAGTTANTSMQSGRFSPSVVLKAVLMVGDWVLRKAGSTQTCCSSCDCHCPLQWCACCRNASIHAAPRVMHVLVSRQRPCLPRRVWSLVSGWAATDIGQWRAGCACREPCSPCGK